MPSRSWGVGWGGGLELSEECHASKLSRCQGYRFWVAGWELRLLQESQEAQAGLCLFAFSEVLSLNTSLYLLGFI